MKLKLSIALLSLAAIAFSSTSSFAAAGSIYTLSNASSGNTVMIFNRSVNGQISAAGAVSTGGLGTGAGLGNQGALAMDADNRFLFAVNAGSDNVSVLKIQNNGLQLLGITPAGGQHPISLTVSHGILYVLNNGAAVGGTDTIAGFAVSNGGRLTPVVSGLPLSAASVGPAEISFNNDGNVLVVTEKATNNVDVFSVDDHGVAVGPTVVASVAQTPYGFAFGKRNEVFVSDAFGGATGAGAVSSYFATAKTLQTISNAVPDLQSAPCWVVVTPDGRFVYTTNTATGNVSGYAVGFSGMLHLLNADGQTASTGTASMPLDVAISNDARYLYVLTPGTSNVQGFVIGLNGSLTPLTQAIGIPASASGLIAR